jgi:acetyl esterase/lipase
LRPGAKAALDRSGHLHPLQYVSRDLPGGQLLLFPMLDDRPVANPCVGEFGWTREHDRFGWTALLGVPAGSKDVPAEAVPGRVPDLSGLPPPYIGIGALDLFVDASLDYAKRLMHGGVPVELPGCRDISNCGGGYSTGASVGFCARAATV